jgi:hypothetical protein
LNANEAITKADILSGIILVLEGLGKYDIVEAKQYAMSPL